MPDFSPFLRRPLAHRGLHDAAAGVFENTLTAFTAAIDGDYGIELDVRLTADDVPVIFHDDTLERLCGRPDRVGDMRYEELKRLTVGTGTDTIPTLRAMLDLVAGRVPVQLELKWCDVPAEKFVALVARELQTYDGPLAYGSFSHLLVAAARAATASLPVGLIAEGKDPQALDWHRQCLSLGLDYVSFDIGGLPNVWISDLRRNAMPVLTWTVRQAQMEERARDYADQIIFEGFTPKGPTGH